ncbi:regulator of G-protein signaling loco isoform X2 [Ischnura elegans]|uniref:regulator of G-protein signaling loco isoform X2 n=1 Tax=Ischnura elegans TaxID=197161 RepID=UPI001ED89806|nr:regulator of G-protein signaling loco isoform X2 [Ischnura elegans]
MSVLVENTPLAGGVLSPRVLENQQAMHPVSTGVQRRRRRKLTHHHSSHHGHHSHHHGGVRTVELRRGRGGFGFTISGQRPCILSCIVAGSPAERAGLRPGDHLVSVNGRGVARAPHDDVVRLVGASAPLLTLKVAETYYFSPSSDTTASDTEAASPVASSSSSDGDDGELREKSHRGEGLVKLCGAIGGRIPPPDRSYIRPRPPRLRHLHKSRTRSSGGVRVPGGGRSPSAARGVSSSAVQATPARAARVVQDLRTGAMFQEMATMWGQQTESQDHCLGLPIPPSILMPPPVVIPSRPPLRKERKERKERRSGGAALAVPRHRERLPAMPYASRADIQDEVLDGDEVRGEGLVGEVGRKAEGVLSPSPIYKAVVGYLGSIEMPEEGRRMQVVRGCIRRMRAERRAHAVVLLSVRSGRKRRRCVEVMSASGNTLASYPASRIAALCACGDARFFGLVVTTSAASLDADHNVSHPPSLPLTGRSSCHVFAVEPGLRPHEAHAAHALAFGINCNAGCLAFPDSAIPVLQSIATICGGSISKGNHSGTASGTDDLDSPGVPNRRRKARAENVRASLGDLLLFVDPSAPPALASVTPSLSSGGGRHPSSTSSNSDSGIGFRDDRGAMALDVSDREAAVPHLSHQGNTPPSCPCASGGRLTVRAMPDPVIVNKCQYADGKEGESTGTKECTESWVANPGSSLAAPLPKPSSSSSLSSFGHRPTQQPESVIEDPVLSYKLSPKVYGLPVPLNVSDGVRSPVSGVTSRDERRRRRRRMKSSREQGISHSLEDIKPHGSSNFEESNRESLISRVGQGSLECVSDWSIASKVTTPAHHMNMSGSGGGLWGSLQDIRCLENSPSASRHQFLSQAEVEVERNAEEEGDGCMSDLEQMLLSTRHLQDETQKVGSACPIVSEPTDTKAEEKSADLKAEGGTGLKSDATVAAPQDDGTLMGPPPPPPPPPPLAEERGVDIGRVGGWASSFEKLLEDPIGLHTFAEFLKKEFSAENIYFWVACERYRNTPNDPNTKSGEGKASGGQQSRRAALARDIFNRHLCLGAPEPVNVDSHARQETEEGLGGAQPTLFLQAQKQIFNLMKFDSYPRFLKSELYKECLLRDMSGQSFSFGASMTLDADLCLNTNQDGDELQSGKQLKKSRSDAEERRRKSLLPWHRKNRSKSKDRGETDYQKMRAAAAALIPNSSSHTGGDDASSSRSDLASSRSSLASSDLALIQRGALARQSLTSSEWSAERAGSEGAVSGTAVGSSAPCPLCRVILPDGATTVVNTGASRSILQPPPTKQTVRELVNRLLEKRGLKYTAFEVYFCDSASDGKPLDLEEDIQMLGSREVRVERRIIFRVDLPSRKTIGVKSGPDRTLGHVLRPILHKYGYRLENVALCLMSENEVLEPSVPVTAVDDEKIQVLTKSGDGWKPETGAQGSGRVDGGRPAVQGAPTLDEITNRVFEELLAGKVAEEKAAGPSSRHCNDEGASTSEDRASVRSEDWSSEHSSGIFGRFLRRDSANMDKSRESRLQKAKKGSMKKMKPTVNDGLCNAGVSGSSNISSAAAVMRTLASDFGVGSRVPPTPRLKTGVRPQGRSESDELYEGLKRAQRSRLEDQRGTEINFELPDFLKDKENAPQITKKSRKGRRGDDERKFSFEPVELGIKAARPITAPLTSSAAFVSRLLDCNFNGEGIIPTNRQAERYFSGKGARCVSLPPTQTPLVFKDSQTDNEKSGECNQLNGSAVPHQLGSNDSEGSDGGKKFSSVGERVENQSDLDETLKPSTPPPMSPSGKGEHSGTSSPKSPVSPQHSKMPFGSSPSESSSLVGLSCPPRSPLRPEPPMPPPPRTNCDPPPLPPKPKNLPASVPLTTAPTAVTITSKVHPLLRATHTCKGWGAVNPTFCQSSGDEGTGLSSLAAEKSVPVVQESALNSKRDPRVCRSRRAIYLDQPSSSFV